MVPRPIREKAWKRIATDLPMEKLNAISLAAVDDLHAAIAAATADPGVRVLAITGAGEKAFAAGSDLAEVAHRDLNQALEPIVQGVAERLERCPKPTIAAINGIFTIGNSATISTAIPIRIHRRYKHKESWHERCCCHNCQQQSV